MKFTHAIVNTLALAALFGALAVLPIEAGTAATPAQAAAATQPGKLPWKAGDPPPPLAGIRLGDSRESVVRALGKADTVDVLGEDGWQLTYEKRGLEVAGTVTHGVESILASKRDTGALGGFRVGDHESDVLKRWGPPDSGGLGALVYSVGAWQLSVQEDEKGHIVVLGLALRLDYESTPPDTASQKK